MPADLRALAGYLEAARRTSLRDTGWPNGGVGRARRALGLPDGWVTDVPGLTRNQQLTLLGNGVVPRQAFAAYRDLLDLAVAA